MESKVYTTNLKYNSRESKAMYVFDKYQKLLSKTVLDVGADAMHLKGKILEKGGKYYGIGYGNDIDLEINLEKTPLPIDSDAYDTVLCLDVLEHLEKIHEVFDELCRIAKENVIVSFPNPWSDFFAVLRHGNYSHDESLKFYGLPVKPPIDRHRWFFSEKDALRFINERAGKNGFEVVQTDTHGENEPMGGRGLKGFIGRALLKLIFRKDIVSIGLHHGTLWCVLKKN